MSKKKNNKKDNIQELCSDEEPEICFKDTPDIQGTSIASFSFNNDDSISTSSTTKEKNNLSSINTPTFKRSYNLSREAIRKVDELKAKHPNVTTYVSTIVESAINHYYNYIMNGGSLK